MQEVNRLLKQFMQMEKVMKKMKGGGLRKLMRGLGMAGAKPSAVFAEIRTRKDKF